MRATIFIRPCCPSVRAFVVRFFLVTRCPDVRKALAGPFPPKRKRYYAVDTRLGALKAERLPRYIIQNVQKQTLPRTRYPVTGALAEQKRHGQTYFFGEIFTEKSQQNHFADRSRNFLKKQRLLFVQKGVLKLLLL